MKPEIIGKYTAAATVSLLLTLAPAFSQEGLARQERLEELTADLSGISARITTSVNDTLASMSKLQGDSGEEATDAAFVMLDTIQAETRAVIDTVKVTSPFMSSLDDARATVLVLLRKNERDPPGPGRDRRIADLTTALATIDEKSKQILATEGQLTAILADHAQLRAELMRNRDVRKVQNFVQDLSKMTDQLQQMANVLSEISENVVDVPTETSLSAE